LHEETIAMNANPNEAIVSSEPFLPSGMRHGFAATGPRRSPAPLQILLVEDDEADAYLIRRALGQNPRVVEVMLAENGIEALELFDRRWISPDMAIVDLQMPRKDGHALLKDLATRAAARFPSIVLSSSKSSRDALRATKNGAVEFMTKPKSEEQLKTLLDRAIKRLC
jgi:CheY-like chemotaxis protein